MKETTPTVYNRAKTWQMALFVMNNAATNVFMLFIGCLSYYATGPVGLGTVIVTFLITAMRIFDGVTDPVIGFIIDKTDGKFGKFRPAMLLGWSIMTITLLVMFNTLHKVAESFRLVYFILLYAIYVIGYTFQTACTKSGQSCLTNDPKQRPTFSLYDGVYNIFIFACIPIYTMNVLLPKYTVGTVSGFENPAYFQEYLIFSIVLSGILTALAMFGISGKDKTEFFGLGVKGDPIKFADYIDVIKNNKAIQMLILAASTDKLAGTVRMFAPINIVIFTVATGNASLLGQLGAVTIIPTMIVLFIGIKLATKVGQKQALVSSTIGGLITAVLVGAMMLFGPMNTLSISNINTFTILFLLVYILMGGLTSISGNIVIPMIADCADYETYRSGRYVPGMIGTLFSFIDKLISSFGTTIAGLAYAMIGFTTSLPNNTTPLTDTLMYTSVMLFIGMPMFGWICSLIAMKYYPLTREKMEEIQTEIARIKSESNVTE